MLRIHDNPLNYVRNSSRMTNTAPRMGRPKLSPEVRVVNDFPLALRLPINEHQRTRDHAAREGRSLANFARRVYLMGLAQYEAEQQRIANAVTTY